MICKKKLSLQGIFFGIMLQIGVTLADQSVMLKTILDCEQVFHSETVDAQMINLAPTHNAFGPFHTAERPLLDSYSGLKTKLAWIELAGLPTPVRRLEQLGNYLGHQQLYLKDDGMTNFDIGGNKLRKLEPILADAIAQGAKTIFTFGAVGSNLVTQTCAACSKVNLKSSVFLTPEPNSVQLQNNLLLDYSYNASLYFYPNNEFRKIGVLDAIVQYVLDYQKLPYLVPIGASCPLGAVGYVNAAFELKKQIDQGLLPQPDYIYIALGSVGTLAGLALGLKIIGIESQIVAISSSLNEDDYYQQRFLELAQQTNQLLHNIDSSFALEDVTKIPVIFDFNFVGKGYAYFTQEGAQAIQIFKEYENLDLEGVYTGKCAAAFIEHIQTNPDLKNKIILFWNTFGIREQIHDQQLYKQLPKPLQRFFEEPVQEATFGS